jgi:hypothetical protein
MDSYLTFVDPCITVKFREKNPTRCSSASKLIIPCLYKAQHVSGYTAPIIRSLKLHWQPLVSYTWKVVGRVVYTSKQPSTYEKPEAASAVLDS